MIKVNINTLLAERGLSVGDFAAAVDLSPANVAVLKNGRAKAIRFSTLERICRVLECSVGEILEFVDDEPDSLSETADLLRSPRNARRLFDAIERLETGGSEHDLIDDEE
ncbi:putative transcriptional regulator [Trueperella bonasi]|uniref:Transcriptional regulator n=1 Tax=Trueperella bonasi TaxID=312286 RepID=A0ABT9NEB2_9ACTO|nr:helix-turn-helix domain-containing protein [Trueperella bonasi]MDP9805733.1 putative transcriptional regulator [Trueperella bonasi]